MQRLLPLAAHTRTHDVGRQAVVRCGDKSDGMKGCSTGNSDRRSHRRANIMQRGFLSIANLFLIPNKFTFFKIPQKIALALCSIFPFAARSHQRNRFAKKRPDALFLIDM